MFRFMGTLRHQGRVISSSGEFESVLKDKLYRPDRDSSSLSLSLSSVNDWIRIPSELGPHIPEENITQEGF